VTRIRLAISGGYTILILAMPVPLPEFGAKSELGHHAQDHLLRVSVSGRRLTIIGQSPNHHEKLKTIATVLRSFDRLRHFDGFIRADGVIVPPRPDAKRAMA
jgi:hypothetical protein